MNVQNWPWFKLALVFGAGAIAAGATVAAAASLGTFTPGGTGTSVGIVAACDSTIGVSWNDGTTSPTYSGSSTVANSTFNVSTLKLTGVDAACDGKNYKLVVADSSGTALQSASGTISLSSGTATIPFTANSGKTIEQVVLAIYS